MKSIKKLLFTAYAGIATLGLAACGAKETTTTATTTEAPTTTVEATTTEAPTTTKDDYNMTLVTPAGAPAMSIANMVTDKKDAYTVETGNAAAALQAHFDNADVDAIIAPINLGAAKYKANQNYQLAGVVTWGNIYFVSEQAFTISDITAENSILFGESSIVGAVVKYVLADNGFDNTNATWLSSTNDVVTAYDGSKINMIAEPALTAKVNAIKKSGKTPYVVNFQEEYKKKTGLDSFPQAALFVKSETAKAHESVVSTFISDVTASCAKVTTDAKTSAENAVALSLHTNATILEKALPGCAIKFVKASDAKSSIEKAVEINAKLFGGANPADGFYYA